VRHSWIGLLALLILGCSGLKQPVQPQARLDADSFLRYAQQLEAARDYPAAKQGYQTAQQQYRSIADLPGQLAAQCGIARIAVAENDLTAWQQTIDEMERFTTLHGQNLDYYVLLARIDKLMQDKDYAAVSRLAVTKPEYPFEEALQLQISKLQADSYLNQATPAQAKTMQLSAQQQLNRLKKRQSANSGLLSSAWYALAYYYFQTGNSELAKSYAEKAADRDYRYGDLGAYAHCLWLLAQLAADRKDATLAASYYDRALGIFESQGDSLSARRINTELETLKGE